MTEEWQFRNYYRPRVLIPVSSIADPPSDDLFVGCLTGAELVILRSLLAYCHRKSTFVLTYGKAGYYVPDDTTWDTIDAIVAELEDKLMTGCAELEALLTSMLEEMQAQSTHQENMATAQDGILEALGDLDTNLGTAIGTINTSLGTIDTTLDTYLGAMSLQLQCICEQLPWLRADPATQAIIDQGITDESLITDDPYPTEEPPGISSDHCAIAQLVWVGAYEMLTERIQPVQEFAMSVLVPLVIGVVCTWLGTTVVGIPVGILTAWVWNLIQAMVDGSLEGVANAYYNNKDELICAMYTAMEDGGDYAAASAAAIEVVDSIGDLSPIDKLVMGGLFAPWVLSRMAWAWDNSTAWAVPRVTAGYCSVCSPEDDEFTYEFPPCPGNWTGTGVCYLGLLCVNADYYALGPSENLVAPGAGSYNQVRVEIEWYSGYTSGWTVGGIKYQYWNGSTWVDGSSYLSPTNTQPIGTLNTGNYTTSISEPGGRPIRVKVDPSGGQYITEPYPLEISSLTITFEQV